MSIAEIIAALSLAGTMVLGLAGYMRFKRMTPLEQAQKISAEVGTQSTILKDAWAEIDRLKTEIKLLRAEGLADVEKLKKVLETSNAAYEARIKILEANFVACQKEFEAAKLAWATRELARNAEEKKQ